MVGLMSVCTLIFLIVWSFGFFLFTSCVKVPAYEFDLHLYQVDESLLDCPSGWLKFRNHCYIVIKEQTTFQQADILCQRYGGYLARIDGYNSNKGVGQLISNHNISHAWIGLQRKRNGKYMWSNGQLAEAEGGFWATQSLIQSLEYDLCTVMNLLTTKYGNYRWTLDNCDIRYSAICQTSACVVGQFRCVDGKKCISNSWICDGIYQCDDKSDEQSCPGSCGGHLQGNFQTFHSPHYPQTYPKYSLCAWKLETPVGTRVRLKFESFAVEELYDKLIIYDGSSENDPLVGTYSGTTIPNVPYSSSNFLLVIFQSDQDNQLSGFNATYISVPKDECGSSLIASKSIQWFTSPNFPNSYPHNILCDWVIRSNNTDNLISLQFHSLSLDTSDFIEIRQGDSLSSPLYGRYTNTLLPPVFVSTSNSLFIRLYTDNTKADSGFNVSYTTGCNNTILNGYARIMSPGFGITKYPNRIYCNWTIIELQSRELTIVFDQFDTEKNFDNVTVYLDNKTDYQHSGQSTPLPIRIVDSEIFHITFNPDSQVNRNGWSLTVSYDCPSLNITSHLKVNTTLTTLGTYVLFSCDKGYQLSGTSLLICDIGGRWSSSPPTCKVIDCGSPALPNNMELVSLDTTKYLGRAVYQCHPGYNMTTGNTSICQSTGQWSQPYCTQLNCPKLNMPEKLRFSSSTESHYVYGDVVTFNCDNDYRLVGASMVFCSANGSWSKPTPSCKAPLCPPIFILNGETNATEDVSGGDYVKVSCHHGYQLVGNPIVFCGLNGVYTKLPSCKDIDECQSNVCGVHTCQNVPGSYKCVCNHGYQNPSDNQTICTDVDECSHRLCDEICDNFDGGFRCRCVTGHYLYTENRVRVIKQIVIWPNMTCIAKCPSFTVSNGGVIVADTEPLTTGHFVAPTTVTIHCPQGTHPDGGVIVECKLDGKWNDTVTTCLNQKCEALSAPVNGRVIYSNSSRVYNSMAEYSCDSGYDLVGVQYRFCHPLPRTSLYKWSGDAPLCKVKMCQALPDPTNGRAVYYSTTIGSTMEYKCNCGYQLIGSQSRTCQPDGLWDRKNAICAPTAVCETPVIGSSMSVSQLSPFYTVGTEVSFQCREPGYQISDPSPVKCVIEKPNENKRPTYNMVVMMKFLLTSTWNQSCANIYVQQIVDFFKVLLQNNCTSPKPSRNITANVTLGSVLKMDMTITLSQPTGGSFSSVCQCSNDLQAVVDAGDITRNLDNHVLNGSGDVSCPSLMLKTVDNISITSNWTCDGGYDLMYTRDICRVDLEPVCVKRTDCPEIYISPTTPSPTDINDPIYPVSDTTYIPEMTTVTAETQSKSLANTTIAIETITTDVTAITSEKSPTMGPTSDDLLNISKRADYTTVQSTLDLLNFTKRTEDSTGSSTSNLQNITIGPELTTEKILTTNPTTPAKVTSQKTTTATVVTDKSTSDTINIHSTDLTATMSRSTTNLLTSGFTTDKETTVTNPTTEYKPTSQTTQKLLNTISSTMQSPIITSLSTNSETTSSTKDLTSDISIDHTTPSRYSTTTSTENAEPKSTVVTEIDDTTISDSVSDTTSVSNQISDGTTQSTSSITEAHPTSPTDTVYTTTVPTTKVQTMLTSLPSNVTDTSHATPSGHTKTTLEATSNTQSSSTTTRTDRTETQQTTAGSKYTYSTASGSITTTSPMSPSQSQSTADTPTSTKIFDTTLGTATSAKPTVSDVTSVKIDIATSVVSSQFTSAKVATATTQGTATSAKVATVTTQDTATSAKVATATTEDTATATVSTQGTATSAKVATVTATSANVATVTTQGTATSAKPTFKTTDLSTSFSPSYPTPINSTRLTTVEAETSSMKTEITQETSTTKSKSTDSTITSYSSPLTSLGASTPAQLTTETGAQPTTGAGTRQTTETGTRLTTKAGAQPTTETGAQLTTEVGTRLTTETETQLTTETGAQLTTKGGTQATTEAGTQLSTETETPLTTKMQASTQGTVSGSVESTQSAVTSTVAFSQVPTQFTATSAKLTDITQESTIISTFKTTDSATTAVPTQGSTLPAIILPKYVIQIDSVLLPAELTEACATEINTLVSNALGSVTGVSDAIKNTKTCSKYNINVSIETTMKTTPNAVDVTKSYGLQGQSQSVLTTCGESIAQKLLSELQDSLQNLQSQTACIQSLISSEITFSQWTCADGYIMDITGELCNLLTTTPAVTTKLIPVTTVAPSITTEEITTESTVVTEAATTRLTTPTTTTTPGTTLPPTSEPFYLIQVDAVYTGTNLTSDACVSAMRQGIEDKVKIVSSEIITNLNSWKQCSKNRDIKLLERTGEISILPDILELTAPFALQSTSGAIDTVQVCASGAVQGHIQNKFYGMLDSINPMPNCSVTFHSFEIAFSGWSCDSRYEYDQQGQTCNLICVTPSVSPDALLASTIRFSVPHARLVFSFESVANVMVTNEVFCLSQYKMTMAAMLVNQTTVLNTGNTFGLKDHCSDIYVSLYGIDVQAGDLNISFIQNKISGMLAVKLFSTSPTMTSARLLPTSCLGHLIGILMNVTRHALIGQSTIPSNQPQCSIVTLNMINYQETQTEFCTSGYRPAIPEDVYTICLKDTRTKYISPLSILFTWENLTNRACIDSLVDKLNDSSIAYVSQYGSNPEWPCTSDIVVQHINVTHTMLDTYISANMSIDYELSSLSEAVDTLPACSEVVLRNAKSYFEVKLNTIYPKLVETCDITVPKSVISYGEGFYVCPPGKTWNQITCVNTDGRKKRSIKAPQRKKRSLEDSPAYWNSSIPTCLDMEPPVFLDCSTTNITVYKETWGSVYVNITPPTAIDNSNVTPRITVTPEDFRQPYLFRECTEVVFMAEDQAGNSKECVIHVNLVDVIPVMIHCPVDIVRIPYPTVNDTVPITYNDTGVTSTGSVAHITYHPPAGTLIRIKDHIQVLATATDARGKTTSCNFTYEATRSDQYPEYKIMLSYLQPNLEFNETCSHKYGTEIIWKFGNISIPECDSNFTRITDVIQHRGEQTLTISVELLYMNMPPLDRDKMEHCGNLSFNKMTGLGDISLTPPGCDLFTLTAVPEKTAQGFLCPSNFTVFNKTGKICMYCPRGTYGNDESGYCEPCSVAMETKSPECFPCSENSNACQESCLPGEYSPTGLQPCTKCVADTYTDKHNSTGCLLCPSGKYTINTASVSIDQCQDECPIGHYSENGLVPCKPCPVTFYNDKTRSQLCTECPSGEVTQAIGSTSVDQCYVPDVCKNDSICQNGGSCEPVDGGRYYVCHCPEGFHGQNCDSDTDECKSGPCVKGVCVDGINTYSCTCDQGYTGYNCDTVVDMCSGIDCGSGTCVSGACLCYDGFAGNQTCEEKNECSPDPCEHGGVCIDLIDDFVCNCSDTGYEGKNCSMLPRKCFNGSCLNDGVCHPHISGYSCSCALGYTGSQCEVNIDDCVANYCINGGIGSYSGSQCEVNIDDCVGNYCINGGICVDGIHSYSCLCQPGFNGSYCDDNIMCDVNPCVNRGSCKTTQSGFTCHCIPGYTGTLCELNIDECVNNTCNPGKSTCEDGNNGYTCNCLPGWTGKTCHTEVDECMSSLCDHGSQCTDLENEFSCNCSEGYTGHNCSTEIDECRSSPCYNNGQCINSLTGYSCMCVEGFTGSHCETNINKCKESPCQHNGTCLSLMDSFSCSCVPGWTGQICDTITDKCLSLPCYNKAVCHSNVEGFSCSCQKGYIGRLCETDIDECSFNPCLHDGVCKNLIGEYSCTCSEGYSGSNCEIVDLPCPPCQNEATECHSGLCVCTPGFVGPDCGKERDYWYDLYFLPNGSVETAVTRMKNRNQLSICLWVKVMVSQSSPAILSLLSVDSDNNEMPILSIHTDKLQLSYFTDLSTRFTLLEGSWNHVCLTWDGLQNGEWYLYINGIQQGGGKGYGSGQELPTRQKILLGSGSQNTFQGMISQVNMYDSVLDTTDIITRSSNCSDRGAPAGNVFKWSEFSSYNTTNVQLIEPSVCGGSGCPDGLSGQYCNVTKDTESPVVVSCPTFVKVVTTTRLSIVNWTEPEFRDNREIVNIIQTHRSGQVFAYGEYDVMYIAYDAANNTASCNFTVYVIPSNCTIPVPPSNVIMSCGHWSDGVFCSVRCRNPSLYRFVEEVPQFYKCGHEGLWDPPRGEEFTFPTCAESSEPAGTIQGEMVFLGPTCTYQNREILTQNFKQRMNQWNMEFSMCPRSVCNFNNISVECMPPKKRRRRSTKSTYIVIFDIPVNGSLVSEGDSVLPITQLGTMVKNEEFNTPDFSCDPESLVVKPYVTCQAGQVLDNELCVNCARGMYLNPLSSSCDLCPQGQYTDKEKQVTCLSCGTGYTTEFPGATTSSDCYKSCSVGNFFDKTTSDCKPCDLGYYQDETGKVSCKSCGNGQTTLETGSISVADCKSTCGAGKELSVTGTCEPCKLGTYKPGDRQGSCQSCPYNKSTPEIGATSVEECSVVSCPPDYYLDVKVNKCQVCPPAYHQPLPGQSSCKPCDKFELSQKCQTGEIDECALHQDNCDENAECTDTTESFQCLCKYGYKGNGTYCVDKCFGACADGEYCFIDNNDSPQCKPEFTESFPVAAIAGSVSSLILVAVLLTTVVVCKRRSKKKRHQRADNYQTMDRVHRELEVVTYPGRIPLTMSYRTNAAYSDSDLSDPPFPGRPAPMWPRFSNPQEDLSKCSETSLRRPLRLRITAAMKNDLPFELGSDKGWEESPDSSLCQYGEDPMPQHSSSSSSLSKYRADSNPKDSSPNSSISHDSPLHNNDSPTSKNSNSDSYF